MKGCDQMNINEILPLLANMCIYYYITYHEKIMNQQVDIPNRVHGKLMSCIYEKYMSNVHPDYIDGDIFDIKIMDGSYSQQYELNKQLDVLDMMRTIDEYIDNCKHFYNVNSQIMVISLSPHPLENYISFDHLSIKWIIDLYRY